ncbi:MAG TPA: hypothetical protein VEQ59_09125 [Polyangiaceae bacterium]|nr:hypothetical protein [Polyangiaceae bacterium]
MTAGDWCLVVAVLLIVAWARSRVPHLPAPPLKVPPPAVDEDDGPNIFPLNWTSAASPDGCEWCEHEGKPVVLSCSRRGLTANIRCDPLRPERICLTRLSFWRSAPVRQRHREGLRPPTSRELREILAAMIEAIEARGLAPTLVLLEPEERFETWRQWLQDEAPQLDAYARETLTELDWGVGEVTPFLDRSRFGLELATRLATKLREGHELSYGHRDYCGHGLSWEAGSYSLSTFEDGMPFERLATWPDAEAFSAAVAEWSDYGCSGADPSAPLFVAENAHRLANQRLTRARIEAFLAT